MKPNKFLDKHISWLKFNERVLQEAENPRLQLLERLKFLSIFSSNLDEFFSVKVAILKRYLLSVSLEHPEYQFPEKIIHTIHEEVIRLQARFEICFETLINELKNKNIYFINEAELSPSQSQFVRKYFHDEVRPHLMPILIDQLLNFPYLKDKAIYLAVVFHQAASTSERYALLELPSSSILPRFLVLPGRGSKTHIMFIDDVIRLGLTDMLAQFGATKTAAYCLKMNRDAELDINDDLPMDYEAKIASSLRARKKGRPVRLVYDRSMPKTLLSYIITKVRLRKKDDIIPGGRYHNFKDFIHFPANLIPEKKSSITVISTGALTKSGKIMSELQKKDALLYFPYFNFNTVVDLIREAALDSEVVSIKMTLYRLAKNSLIIHALRNAINNGKKVTVVVELKARFDEEANLYWAQKLKEDGATVCYGITDLKTHAKLLQITKQEKLATTYYTVLGTGNFNEQTARTYTDACLLTTHFEIGEDVANIFQSLETQTKIQPTKHLIVSPDGMMQQFSKLIAHEMHEAKAGRKALILLKMNALSDPEMIQSLYQAMKAGVEVKLVVRGVCCLNINPKTKAHHNLEAVSIIDTYLEHSRIMYFYHGGKEKMYISSGDWMTRNLKRRIEVATPIYDKKIKSFLKNIIEIQLKDNQKARYLLPGKLNTFIKPLKGTTRIRSQYYIYNHLIKKT